MICVSLGNISYDEALKVIKSAEMIEIRADLPGMDQTLLEKLLSFPVKKIFTCRPGTFSEVKRIELFRQAVEKNVDYVDIEYENDDEVVGQILRMTSDTSTEVILSYHNFDITPDAIELKKILMRGYKRGATLVKIATMINSKEDILNLFSLHGIEGRKVLLGMGEKGIITRVAAVLLGSEFTFVSPDCDTKTAPGQISKEEMEIIFRIMNIK